jgi:uncharacterized protein YecE (DUF72 family)
MKIFASSRIAGSVARLYIIDTPKWPTRGVVTADFVYLRFHGQTRLYGSSYDALRGLRPAHPGVRDARLDAYG